MKKIYIFSVLTLIFLAGLFILNSQYQPKLTSNQDNSENQTKDQKGEFIDIDFQNQKIRVVSFKVENPQKISLISNFDEKLTVFEAVEKYQCKNLINGGFYIRTTQDSSIANLPIGLFLADDKKIGNFAQNSLFNGFFKISTDGVPSISSDSSIDNFRIALQSGPILFQDESPLNLRIINDKPERRSVVILTKDNIYFATFYDKTSAYLGPYLASLPQLVKLFSKEKKIKTVAALNLDGGTASSFHSEDFSLPELSPVGSFFCIKN